MGMRIDQSRHHEKSFCVELFTSAPIAPFSCAFYPAGIINLNIAGLHIVELFVQKQAGVGYGYGHRISYIVWIFPSFRRSLIVSSAVVAASAALLPFFPIPMPRSEERRVGKDRRLRGSTYDEQKTGRDR